VAVDRTNSKIDIFFGNMAGTRGAPTAIAVASPSDAVVGRFDADAFDDLAVSTGGKIAVYLGKGDGTFAAPVTSAVGYARLITARIDGDALDDIVTYDTTSHRIYAHISDGAGAFKTSVLNMALFEGNYVRDIHAGQLNNDDKTDLLVATQNIGDLVILPGDGKGNFGPPDDNKDFIAGGAWAIAIGRFNGPFNGDPWDDIAFNSDGNVQTILQDAFQRVTLTEAEAQSWTMTPPKGLNTKSPWGKYQITVTATATEALNGDQAKTSVTKRLHIGE
jgi:hypothetical protein